MGTYLMGNNYRSCNIQTEPTAEFCILSICCAVEMQWLSGLVYIRLRLVGFAGHVCC